MTKILVADESKSDKCIPVTAEETEDEHSNEINKAFSVMLTDVENDSTCTFTSFQVI